MDGQSLEELASLSPDEGNWRPKIRVPEFVVDDELAAARSALREKGQAGAFYDVSGDVIEEGDSVQMLHVGPYEDEARTLLRRRPVVRG